MIPSRSRWPRRSKWNRRRDLTACTHLALCSLDQPLEVLTAPLRRPMLTFQDDLRGLDTASFSDAVHVGRHAQRIRGDLRWSSRLCAKQISGLGLCMMAAHTARDHHWRRLRDIAGRLMEAADGYFAGQRSAQDPCPCRRRAATPRMPREPHSPEVALPCWHGNYCASGATGGRRPHRPDLRGSRPSRRGRAGRPGHRGVE